MKRESNNQSFIAWLEDIWEEIEIQFYGITRDLKVFVLLYLFFHPRWMRPLIDFALKN